MMTRKYHKSSPSFFISGYHHMQLQILMQATNNNIIMGLYLTLFGEDCRYFCCSSQNHLMKSEIFIWSVSKIIYLKSLFKSALTGKDAFDITS